MEEISSVIKDVCKKLFDIDIDPELTRPDEQFGDYATNAALRLGKQLGKNPREVAEAITAEIESDSIANSEVAGPGFINITLTDTALLNFGQPTKAYSGKKVVIETNNPNPFKDIHIGHGFNSVVADTIANLLEVGGAEVHRVSYHGDVGLHVGKSLWAIFDKLGDDPIPSLHSIDENERPQHLREWYAHGAGLYEEDPSIKEAVEAYAKQSFMPEGKVKEVYDTCKDWSFQYFDYVFNRLGSRSVEKRYLESQADTAGRQIVEANIGKVFERSDEAIVFHGEEYEKGLHTRVFISRHGTTLYEARDLGLMQLKNQDYQPDCSYIVTAEEQKEYFRVVFKAAELAMPDMNKTINIPTGTVKLTTGKMSSRTGDVVTIEWLFEQIEAGIRKLTENEQTIQDSAIAAIRYAMLRSRLDTDTIFDIEKSVALEGNTGPYLQYAHARARSILAKSPATSHQPLEQLQPDERSLVRKMGEYHEAINRAVDELMPHHICTYLYELAQAFNRFYEHNRVINDPRQDVRLQLVNLYADTLKNGLELLNIPAPDRM